MDPREQDLFDVNTTVDLSGYYDVSDDDDNDGDDNEGDDGDGGGGGASSTWHYDASNVDFDSPEFRALPCVARFLQQHAHVRASSLSSRASAIVSIFSLRWSVAYHHAHHS